MSSLTLDAGQSMSQDDGVVSHGLAAIQPTGSEMVLFSSLQKIVMYPL